MIETDSSEALRKACRYELKTESTKEQAQLNCVALRFHRRVMQMESN